MAVIRATAEITLRRRRTDGEYRNALSKILETSVETSELLENLLTLARADASAAAMTMQLVDLGKYVRKAKERAVGSIRRQGAHCHGANAAGAGMGQSGCHRDRPASPDFGRQRREVHAAGRLCEIELSRDQAQAVITVRDTGIGISEVDLPSIFERFVRADRTRSRETPGAGLGLAIARWITEVHGGTIAVESQVGVGSVFRVSLPVLQESHKANDVNEMQAEVPRI